MQTQKLKSTTLNKEIEPKMCSKNQSILDFKGKKTQNDEKDFFFFFFFQKIEPGDFFFQKVETDHPASRVTIQSV